MPVQLDGLGLFVPFITAARQRTGSQHTHMFSAHVFAALLVDLVVSQIHDASTSFVDQVHLYSEIYTTQEKELKEFVNSVYDQLLPDLHSSVKLACKKGTSNWLSCLPLKFYGYFPP